MFRLLSLGKCWLLIRNSLGKYLIISFYVNIDHLYMIVCVSTSCLFFRTYRYFGRLFLDTVSKYRNFYLSLQINVDHLYLCPHVNTGNVYMCLGLISDHL